MHTSPIVLTADQLQHVHGGHGGLLESCHLIIGAIELFNYTAGHIIKGREGMEEDDYFGQMMYYTYDKVTGFGIDVYQRMTHKAIA